ncbi:MAG: type II secretion system protein N [Pseudomonadota bacterium]
MSNQGRQAEARGGQAWPATLASLICACLLALAGVRLFFAFVAPLQAPDLRPLQQREQGPQLEASLAVLRTAELFVQESEAESFQAIEELPETTLRLVLKGVTPTDGGVSGATIQTPDGKQGYFREGEEIIRGATLAEVQTFRAVISRNGRREALTLKNRPDPDEPNAVAAPTAVRSTNSPAATPPASATRRRPAVTLLPVPDDIDRRGAAATLRSLARDMLPSLEAQGFQGDDIPYAVNGKIIPSDTAGITALLAEARSQDTVIVTVARDGRPQNVSFTLSQLRSR